MNKVCLDGSVGSALVLRKTVTGAPVVAFYLSVMRDKPNAEGAYVVDRFPVVAFWDLAAWCARELSQGSNVSVEGKLHMVGCRNNGKPSKIEIYAQNVQFALDENENPQDGEIPAFEQIDFFT